MYPCVPQDLLLALLFLPLHEFNTYETPHFLFIGDAYERGISVFFLYVDFDT